MDRQPKITVCIPHWQVRSYMTVCLRSIRRHSAKYNLDVLVIDNGSQDDSLDYLRSLDWIRLIERPEEKHTNWPANVFSAWDVGVHNTDAEFFITMHSDVFVKSDHWLDPLLRAIGTDENIAASGAWKLDLENPMYAWQKQVFGYLTAQAKSAFGRKRNVRWKQGDYPRDYCAMYRSAIILKHKLTFGNVKNYTGGGHSIAMQLFELGYTMGMIPVREMAQHVVHVAHGTAAISPEKKLNHQRAQRKVEKRVANLFNEWWIKSLEEDASLDRLRPAA